MRNFHENWLKAGVAKHLQISASKGVFTLRNQNLRSIQNQIYLETCRAIHHPSGTGIVFTRDSGHHSSGWWKNPDYDRCLHLSLSFVDPETGEPTSQQHQIANEWVSLLFPSQRNYIWTEPPYSDHGKILDVWHYRVFYHEDWKTPILPRGEVYTKTFTDARWLSWSDRREQLIEEGLLLPPYDPDQCRCSSPPFPCPCTYCEQGDWDRDSV